VQELQGNPTQRFGACDLYRSATQAASGLGVVFANDDCFIEFWARDR